EEVQSTYKNKYIKRPFEVHQKGFLYFGSSQRSCHPNGRATLILVIRVANARICLPIKVGTICIRSPKRPFNAGF
ncbi:MAG: hypothetical protein QMB11_10170, partial [Nonlabens sp.]|uniref:hypothetical protein n=1 Tax=Nonlabens sp. TaxID=1888209 RepID=UPI0035A69576